MRNECFEKRYEQPERNVKLEGNVVIKWYYWRSGGRYVNIDPTQLQGSGIMQQEMLLHFFYYHLRLDDVLNRWFVIQVH